MAVNWGLAEPTAGPLDILRMAGQAQMERLQQQQQKAAFTQQQRVQAARPAAQAALAKGDYEAAQTTSLGAGDFDYAKAISGLSKEHQERLAAEANVLGSVSYGIKSQKTPEARAAAFEGSIPALKQHGFSDEEINSAAQHLTQTGWADEALDGYINSAQTVQQQIAGQVAQQKANAPTQVERELAAAGVQPGSEEWKSAILGHVNPSQFMEVGSDATGRQLIQTRGAGVAPTAAVSGPVGPQIEQAVSELIPGAKVTSGRRSPEHNREVGGVGNSYHLTDQARDYVPPPNVSMGQFAQTLKANMSGFDVINEGDHVHIEPSKRPAAGGGPRVVYSTPPAPNGGKAPSGYRYAADGNLQPIPGGPADPAGAGNKNTTSNRRAEADLRKEFDNLPEVKNFRVIRGQAQSIKRLAGNPSAQNDIAMIFSYMKMLDPTSVVREGEFATAQNAAGVPDQIRNMFNKAQEGERLNPQQRVRMVQSANNLYTSARGVYNERADQFRGYASDNGVAADRVASRYVNKPKKTPPAPQDGRFRGFKIVSQERR